MTTLSHLRALLDLALTRTENPALGRCERTVEGVARCYLPRILWVFWPGQSLAEQVPGDVGVRLLRDPAWFGGDVRLDLTDPGTAHALLVGLALARGMDPGPASLDVRWAPSGEGWNLSGPPCAVLFRGYSDPHSKAVICAPTVANEPNPIAALELAVKHTLEQS